MKNQRLSYLVLGAGGVGKPIAYLLSTLRKTGKVIIADKDPNVALSAADSINKLEPRTVCFSKVWDADNPKKSLFSSGFDVIISALPAKYNFSLADMAIKEGVNFVDLGGIVSVTERMIRELNDKALAENLSVVPDCGVMPGLGIMQVRTFVQELDKTDSAIIYVGGVPQKPRPPLYYERHFHLEGIGAICYDTVTVIENGKLAEKPPLSELVNFTIPELARYSPDGRGTVEAFVTAGASLAHESFLRLGIGSFCEKTVRWPGFAQFVSQVPREQFSQVVGGLITRPINTENPDILWMKVVVTGEKNGKPVRKTAKLVDFYDTETDMTAMGRCTGFPTALMAERIALCESLPGVNTPENAFKISDLKSIISDLGTYLDMRSME